MIKCGETCIHEVWGGTDIDCASCAHSEFENKIDNISIKSEIDTTVTRWRCMIGYEVYSIEQQRGESCGGYEKEREFRNLFDKFEPPKKPEWMVEGWWR